MTDTVTLSRESFERLKVDAAIVSALVPQLYVAMDDLMDHVQGAPKELLIRAKKLLPAWAPHSFEQSPLGAK